MPLSDEPQGIEEALRDLRESLGEISPEHLKAAQQHMRELLQDPQENIQQHSSFRSSESQSSATRPSERGQVWARWEYSPEEWKRFDWLDWQIPHLRFTFWLLVVLVGGNIIPLVVALTSFAFLSYSTVDTLFITSMIVWCAMFNVLIWYLIYTLPAYIEAKKRHKARLKLPRTVTLSGERVQDGFTNFCSASIWVAGTFFPLDSTERFLSKNAVALKQVTLTTEPSILHFHLKKEVGVQKVAWRNFTFRLLVPCGHEDEAGQLLERFQTEVIYALARKEEEKKRKEERRLNPLEPL